MTAPAQPKKIVAPTVSQINAEFVTQVRLGESGVCEGVRTLKPRGQDVGFFLGTGAARRHSFVNSYTQVFLLKSTCCVPATVLAVGETVVKEALPRGVHVPGETDT